MEGEFDWHSISVDGAKALWVLTTQEEIDRYHALSAFQCKHDQTELRDFPTSNGGWQRKNQCLVCGRSASNPTKRDPSVDAPVWDRTLPETFDRSIQRQRRQLEDQFIARTAELEIEGYADYEEYLRSADWLSRRGRVMDRDGGKCQACLDAQATEVHHLTYDHIFDEPLFDLVSVCRACHEKLHIRKIVARAAADAKAAQSK